MAENTKRFESSLRAKIGMPQPEDPKEKLAEVWTAMEEALSGLPEAVETIKAAVDEVGDPEIEEAIGAGVEALTEALDTSVTAIEAVEDVLVEMGLVEDDELLEPEAEQA